MRRSLQGAAGFLLVACSVAAAGPQPEQEALDALRQELEAQRQRTDALEREVERLREARPAAGDASEPGAAPTPAPADRPWLEHIKLSFFRIEDTERHWRLSLHGRLQVDGRFALERGQRDFANGFVVRRARVSFRGSFYERFGFDIGLEFGRTSDADLRNAYMTFKVCSGLEVWAGQMLLPFSDERLMSSKFLTHVERAMLVANIVGDREVGAQLHASALDELFRCWVGAFNGDGQNLRRPHDDDLDVAARVMLRPLRDEHVVLTANYIYSPPNHDQTGPADLISVGGELTTVLDYAATNRRRGRRQRAGGGVKVGFGSWELRAEVDVDYQERMRSAATSRADLLNWEWFVDGTIVVLGEMVHEPDGFRVRPDAPFYDPEAGAVGPGAFQLSVRYEDLHADRDALRGGFAVGTDRVRAVTVSGHWYPWREVRLSASYTYSDFDDRVTDSRGRRHGDEHALIVRAAFWF